MPDLIPIAQPLIGEEEAAAAREALLSGWITQGPRVAAFEKAFASRVGAPHAVAVSSGTTALHLALLAVGVVPGDEVVTVSHSFIATANSVRYCGAEPVFVDIDRGTFNMAPREIEGAITRRTRAILCVHQMGMPCDLAAILEIGAHHGLAVVEDAACAIGSEIAANGGWQLIGRPHGDLACFSFHPRKVITTGDGGMITARDGETAAKLRKLRQHGMSISDATRHHAREVTFEEYPMIGYNYRMTDVQAAIGSVQLGRLSGIIDRRRALGARYGILLRDIAGLQLPEEPAWARSNWQSYCVRLPPGHSQRAVMQAMLDRGVATRRGVMCAHREAPYANPAWRLPQSEAAQDQCILLPLYPHMSEQDQERVVDTLSQVLKAGGRGREGRLHS